MALDQHTHTAFTLVPNGSYINRGQLDSHYNFLVHIVDPRSGTVKLIAQVPGNPILEGTTAAAGAGLFWS